MAIQKARRSMTKIKLALSGVSGSGKTASGLLMAFGLVKSTHPDWSDEKIWESIVVIDTENGSAPLYANSKIGQTTIGEFSVLPLEPEFIPERYITAIDECLQFGAEVIVIDSFSHAWLATLEEQSKIAQRTGNSYTSWRTISPRFAKLVDKILQSNCHVIVTMRSKQEYVVEQNQKGKQVPRKVGMASVMRDGIEYEFSLVLDIDISHNANSTKDRTGLFPNDRIFTITTDTGKEIYDWLNESKGAGKIEEKPEPKQNIAKTTPKPDPAPEAPTPRQEIPEDYDDGVTLPFDDVPAENAFDRQTAIAKLTNLVRSTPNANKRELGAKIKSLTGMSNAQFANYTDEHLRILYNALIMEVA